MYKTAQEITNIKTTKELKLYDVMEAVNNKKIKPYEAFYIHGYLSSTACLEVPETYFSEMREYVRIGKEFYNGKTITTADMEVSENSLPQCNPNYGEDICIAFLYTDKEKRFTATKDKNAENILTRYNQFIPVILNEEDYYKNVDSYVRLKCYVTPLTKLFFENDIKMKDSKYSYLYECFYDIYQPLITSFFLKCLDISSDISLNYDNTQILQFVVEYEILSSESSRGLKTKVESFVNKNSSHRLPRFFDFESGHRLFPSQNNISICVKDKKIGFYKKIKINDSKEYKKEVQDLENYIKLFFKKNRCDKEISFISDYRRRDIFDI